MARWTCESSKGEKILLLVLSGARSTMQVGTFSSISNALSYVHRMYRIQEIVFVCLGAETAVDNCPSGCNEIGYFYEIGISLI